VSKDIRPEDGKGVLFVPTREKESKGKGKKLG